MSTRRNRSPEVIRRTLSEVNWDLPGFVPGVDTSGIHRIHWYPAVFPPAIAISLIDALSEPGERVLDPFCGSGVCPIEAWLKGRQATGTDSSSIALRLVRTKVRLVQKASDAILGQLCDLTNARFAQIVAALGRHRVERLMSTAGIHSCAPKWFTPATLIGIAALKQIFIELPTSLVEWREVLEVLASGLLHRTLSRVRNYHHSYIVDRSVVAEYDDSERDVRATFVGALASAFRAGGHCREQLRRSGAIAALDTPPVLARLPCDRLGDAEGPFDLVVTSPPYFGMNDYVRSQYLSWIIFGWPEFDDDLSLEIGSRRNRRNTRAFDEYVASVSETFAAVHGLLRPGGHLALTLGQSDSRIAASRDPVATLRSRLRMVGFSVVWEGVRRVMFRKINSTPYRTEALWVLRK